MYVTKCKDEVLIKDAGGVEAIIRPDGSGTLKAGYSHETVEVARHRYDYISAARNAGLSIPDAPQTRAEAISEARHYAGEGRFVGKTAYVFLRADGTYGWIDEEDAPPEEAWLDLVVDYIGAQKAAGSRSLHTPSGHMAGAPDLGYNRVHGAFYGS